VVTEVSVTTLKLYLCYCGCAECTKVRKGCFETKAREAYP
jgi:hypothetical protein